MTTKKSHLLNPAVLVCFLFSFLFPVSDPSRFFSTQTSSVILQDSPPPLSPMSDELDGDPEKAIIQCFERSGDLSLLYLQECDKLRQNLPTYQAYLEGGQVSMTVISLETKPPHFLTPSHLSVAAFFLLCQILTGQNLVGPVLDSALRRGPLLRLKGGDLGAAVGRFRHLLQAVEARSTKQLRQTLARQLAEVLLRGMFVGLVLW